MLPGETTNEMKQMWPEFTITSTHIPWAGNLDTQTERASSNSTLESNTPKKDTGALKFDTDKPPMDLLSRTALEEIAKVMGFGAQKYAAHNWRKGFDWSRPLAAAMRHIQAFNDGEDKDPESGLSHLAHAGCCIMFLLEFEKTHRHLDNRYKAPNA